MVTRYFEEHYSSSAAKQGLVLSVIITKIPERLDGLGSLAFGEIEIREGTNGKNGRRRAVLFCRSIRRSAWKIDVPST